MTDGMVVQKTPKLSKRVRAAIDEALRARLAGEIEDDGYLEIRDYKRALEWIEFKSARDQ